MYIYTVTINKYQVEHTTRWEPTDIYILDKQAQKCEQHEVNVNKRMI